ncbi:ABC transporter ATP-binding protein [Staphylococcus hominis]|uniref:ElxT n=1 Tax=Staphylococcus epidermidis TaxID=1282 RepID=I6ZHK9_STAEP|nr:ElxT [Staphylococcus epidermidis]
MKTIHNNPLFYLFKKIRWPKKIFFTAIIITSLGSLSELAVPLLTGKFIDILVSNGINYKFISLLTLVFILDALLNGVGMFLLIKAGEKIIYSIRLLLWNKIIYLEVPFFDKNDSGQLISRLTDDTALINNFISRKIPSVIPEMLTLLGSLIMLFVMDWKMTLLTFIIIPLFLLVIIPLSNIIESLSQSTQLEIAKFTGIINRALSAIRLVKISNTENKELITAEKKLNAIYRLNIRHARITAILEPFSNILLIIMIGIILGFGGYRISTGVITSGTLVTMIFYVVQLSSPITSLSTLLTDYKNAKGATKRIFEILKEQQESFNGIPYNKKQSYDLSFSSVYFSYNKKHILKDISFNIPKNKTTAIVGPSGAGKTTIFSLITRMYKIDSGAIKVGNESIYNFNLAEWRENIGYVMQNNSMISGTIKENILYGIKQDVSKDVFEKYVRFSNSHNFIMSLESQYNSEVGESGNKLSGGQKQRINIARNLIKDPEILLLDEATSSLDSDSETKIQKSLNFLSKNRTTIIIAHRLSTIKDADQIIFLDNGKITGIGKHTFLMETHPKYKKFVLNQKLS